MRAAAIAALTLYLAGTAPAMAAAPTGFERLQAGQLVHGFRAQARYRDASGGFIGARYVHARSGFTLDLLRIPSVPQAFIYVNTWPSSDKGEPHTQEHLLLGKGNHGREVATLDSMSLTESTAYTEQRRTVYQFYTSAGPAVFYDLLEKRMDALLHPDYTDEEIRREVRNFGLKKGPQGLELEEQGTVYNEMTSTYDQPWTAVYHQVARDVYGPAHPLALESGGTPEALRALTPAEIRRFHAGSYHLPNMGMIASLPKTMPVDQALATFDGILNRLEPNAATFKAGVKHDRDLPAPRPAAPGTIEVLSYPDENAKNPGQLLFSWPATTRFATQREHMLASLFCDAFAGDDSTNLYKAFVNSKTRVIETGTTGVSAGFDDDQGHPFHVAFGELTPGVVTPEGIGKIRGVMQAELRKVAAYPDGSPELEAFQTRVRALVKSWRRSMDKFVNSPPGFGFRNSSDGWMRHLDNLAEVPGFDKHVTLDTDLAAVERLLAGKQNFWGQHLRAWGVLDQTPIAVASKADPALVKRQRADHDARVAAEARRLEALYHTTDEQTALKRYEADYAARTHELDALSARSSEHKFLAHPPLGNDPDLEARVVTMPHGIPLVASTFDNMTGASLSLDVPLDGVREDQLPELTMLPALLTDVGLIVDGQPLSNEEVTRRTRNEILGMSVGFANNPRTHRHELTFHGSGNNRAETERAVTWLERTMTAPDWRVENLARIRDVVDQTVTGLHQSMSGAEESWVSDPAAAFRWQRDPLELALDSFLTQEHLVHRLRWMLRADVGPGDHGEKPFAAFLTGLSQARGSREELAGLAAALAAEPSARAAVAPGLAGFVKGFDALPKEAQAQAKEAAKDLGLALADLPEGSLAADWGYLCREMRDDFLVGPRTTLARLNALRKQVLATGGARMVLVGARPLQQAMIAQPIPRLLGHLAVAARPAVAIAPHPVVNERVAARLPGAKTTFVGLVDPKLQSGVFVNAAPLTTYRTRDKAALENLLAAELYGGGGAHSLFMKTWGAGLAYSNGIGASPVSGDVHYYAERCPELPQTLGFVIGTLKNARPDPSLVEYAFAQLFNDSRAALSYESRGAGYAADLADGNTRGVVQGFRQALLGLRNDGHLTQELFARMPAVYGKVLPGLSGKVSGLSGTNYFVIGAEKQLAAYERYLKGVEGPDATVVRLYPRDFWITRE